MRQLDLFDWKKPVTPITLAEFNAAVSEAAKKIREANFFTSDRMLEQLRRR